MRYPTGGDTMREVENERVKLLAGFLNGVAVALMAIGVIAPLSGAALGIGGYERVSWPVLIVGLLAQFTCAILVHALAQRVLRRLKP